MALLVNPREKRLLSVLGGVFGVIAVLAVPLVVNLMVDSRKSDNDELRVALTDVQEARGKVRDRQAKKDAIASRYAKRAPALGGFIEEKATKNKLEITDSADRPELPVGKRYTERSSNVHLKKAGMYAVSKFLEDVEKSGNAVAVTRLAIHKRTGEPDSYDVEVGISAYDRNPDKVTPAPDSAADKDNKDKGSP